ncbi:MAG: hypothetical protein KIT11_01340 [Fimbriimonadaceae bacterium]|nr:hypothetical protein [Fimbriimonadaceae bacterium]QYK54983.1 MAG: hypothetical protein KF733_08195 [Fimbriimonadaceae bacterium]
MRKLLSLGAFMLLCTLAAFATAVESYSGSWEISRGARGTIRMTVSNDRVTGSMTDEGWYDMTGERRTGRIDGTLTGRNARFTVYWSTGATMEFNGRFSRANHEFEFNGTRKVNGKNDRDTSLKIHSYHQGYNPNDPTGIWEGSFNYSGTGGRAKIRVDHNDEFTGTMYGDDGRKWKVSGRFNSDRNAVRIKIDSGASKREYTGKYEKIGDGRIRLSLNDDGIKLSVTLRKNS